MLRGVNRQIIEINSTDNCYFEKAILFVRPEFSELSETKLQNNANLFLKNIQAKKERVKVNNKKAKKQKRKLNKKLLFSFGLTAFIVAASVVVILRII